MDDQTTFWWRWFGMSLYLLLPVDLLTTILAVSEHGAAVESNPISAWLLAHGLVVVTIANLVVLAAAVVLFDRAIDGIRRAPPRYRDCLVRGVNLWVSFLFCAGVVLAVNNLLAVV